MAKKPKRPRKKARSKCRGQVTAPRRRSRRHLCRVPGEAVIANGAIIWKLPCRLRSLNSLKTGIARHSDTVRWEKYLANAQCISNDGSVHPKNGHGRKKLRLEVQRLTPSRRYILDQTNLQGGAKGLEDALMRLGLLVDDGPQWLEGPIATQALSTDGYYWTIIKLSVAKNQTMELGAPLWTDDH